MNKSEIIAQAAEYLDVFTSKMEKMPDTENVKRLVAELYAIAASAGDAPAVQGEPVAVMYEDGSVLSKADCGDNFEFCCKVLTPLYAAPQPAEQQPSAGDSLTSVPGEVFAAEFAAWWDEHGQFCRAGGGTYEQSFAFEAWRHLYPQLMNLQMAAAEPDVSRQVEALESIAKLPIDPCSTENDYRLSAAKAIASAAISAHRKGGSTDGE